MDDQTFHKYTSLIYNYSGIALGQTKKELVRTRVAKRMRLLDIPDYRDYYQYVVQDLSGKELAFLLDVISTNVTSFFRENDHFDFLSAVIKEWHAEGHRRFRFWSAGCATGEEPFSLAITILEALSGGGNPDVKILATDISRQVLDIARQGVYERKKLDHFPIQENRYFKRIGENKVKAQDFLRKMVVFKYLNLQGGNYPFRGPLDAIFCRNVMIYFDEKGRTDIIGRFYNLLKDNGYLFVGHSESLMGITTGFQYALPSIYQKKSI